ncbi:hypothetical protein AMTRI_Chr04g247500 [Amborella trichopoda]
MPLRVHERVRTWVTLVLARIRVGQCGETQFETRKEMCEVRLTSRGWGRMHLGKDALLDFGTLKRLRNAPRPLFGLVWSRPLHDLRLNDAHLYCLGCMSP